MAGGGMMQFRKMINSFICLIDSFLMVCLIQLLDGFVQYFIFWLFWIMKKKYLFYLGFFFLRFKGIINSNSFTFYLNICYGIDFFSRLLNKRFLSRICVFSLNSLISTILLYGIAKNNIWNASGKAFNCFKPFIFYFLFEWFNYKEVGDLCFWICFIASLFIKNTTTFIPFFCFCFNKFCCLKHQKCVIFLGFKKMSVRSQNRHWTIRDLSVNYFWLKLNVLLLPTVFFFSFYDYYVLTIYFDNFI